MSNEAWYTPGGEAVDFRRFGPSPFKNLFRHYRSLPPRFVLCKDRDCQICWLRQEVKLEAKERMQWSDDGGPAYE